MRIVWLVLGAYVLGALFGWEFGLTQCHAATPPPRYATVRAGAEICEDVPQFADCFTVTYPLAVRVIKRDDLYTRVVTVTNRYVVDNKDIRMTNGRR